MSPDQRQQAKIQTLRDDWNTLHDNVAGLRRQLVLETRAEESSRIRQVLRDKQNLLDEIEAQIERLERSANPGLREPEPDAQVEARTPDNGIPYEFETVFVDAQGNINRRERKHSRQ